MKEGQIVPFPTTVTNQQKEKQIYRRLSSASTSLPSFCSSGHCRIYVTLQVKISARIINQSWVHKIRHIAPGPKHGIFLFRLAVARNCGREFPTDLTSHDLFWTLDSFDSICFVSESFRWEQETSMLGHFIGRDHLLRCTQRMASIVK